LIRSILTALCVVRRLLSRLSLALLALRVIGLPLLLTLLTLGLALLALALPLSLLALGLA